MDYFIQGSTLENIGNAIRAKTGESSTYSPSQMASKITSDLLKPSGTLPVTQNNTYNVAQYASVTINIPMGFFPSVRVTAPTGSTVTLTYGGVTRTATETSGVWLFENLTALGSYTVAATFYGETKTQTVNVSEVKQYDVAIAFTKQVTITGSGSTDYGYVTVNGTDYTSAATIDVPGGSSIVAHVKGKSASQPGTVKLNGTVVLNNTTTSMQNYTYTIPLSGVSSVEINIAGSKSTGYGAVEIKTNA